MNYCLAFALGLLLVNGSYSSARAETYCHNPALKKACSTRRGILMGTASEITAFDTDYFYNRHFEWGPVEYETIPPQINSQFDLDFDLIGRYRVCTVYDVPANRYGDTTRTCIEDGKDLVRLRRGGDYFERLCEMIHKFNSTARWSFCEQK